MLERRIGWAGMGALGAGLSLALLAGATAGCGKLRAIRALSSAARPAASAPGSPRGNGPQSPFPTAMVVAPAPLPTALPLKARPGTDAYGYPRSYVDGPGLRSLLVHEHFAELSRYIEDFQAQFEADATKELWPIRAVEAFSTADPALIPLLDAWIKATPSSFAPHAARGAYWTEVAYFRRGTKWAKDTPESNFAAMREAAHHARANLEHALELAPRLVAGMRLQISLAIPTGDQSLSDDAMHRAEAVCPTCFSVRAMYLVGLEPRWGGSFQQMTDFATHVPVAQNARLKLLPGYVDRERARVVFRDNHLDEALALANAACAVGQHWDFLDQRAEIFLERREYAKALADLDVAIDQRPELPHLYLHRARAKYGLGDPEAAGRDLIESMRLDASEPWALWLLPRIVKDLTAAGTQASSRGDRDAAVRLLERASELAPFNREVSAQRERAVRGGVNGSEDELTRLEAAAQQAPDDFGAHQQLDFALAKAGRYPRVIAMWTEYLARHPKDGKAYFERSGAYHNSGHPAEAFADLDKACELGVDQACAYKKALGR